MGIRRATDGAGPYLLFALTGVVVAVAVSLGVAAALGLDLRIQALAALAGCLTFPAVRRAAAAVQGDRSLTWYRHALPVLAASAAVAALSGASVLGHLDATAIGLCALLAHGRLGCWRAGCCHGRPATRGLIYSPLAGAPALPSYLRGRRVVPVPLIESGAVTAIGVAACVLAGAAEPGRAVAFQLVAYALVRLALEEWRGDWRRPYWHGLSEAQWTALVVLTGVTLAARAGVLPSVGWAVIPLLAAGELALLSRLRRRRAPLALDARHVAELVGACAIGPSPPLQPRVRVTSQGVRVTSGALPSARHVSLSRGDRPLEADEAADLAAVVASACLTTSRAAIAIGPTGVMHVVAEHARGDPAPIEP